MERRLLISSRPPEVPTVRLSNSHFLDSLESRLWNVLLKKALAHSTDNHDLYKRKNYALQKFLEGSDIRRVHFGAQPPIQLEV